jgi:hypothetical protein
MQNIATDSLIGRDTASTGDPETIGVTGGLEFDGAGNIRRSALTGDATASAGSNAVTVAKINGITVSGTPSSGQVLTAGGSTTASWQDTGTTPPTSAASNVFLWANFH